MWLADELISSCHVLQYNNPDSDWPAKDECDTYVQKVPDPRNLSTIYLSPENKGFEWVVYINRKRWILLHLILKMFLFISLYNHQGESIADRGSELATRGWAPLALVPSSLCSPDGGPWGSKENLWPHQVCHLWGKDQDTIKVEWPIHVSCKTPIYSSPIISVI